MRNSISEAKLQLGRRTDDYLILTVGTLEKLGRLVLDGITIQFRKVHGEEFLCHSVPRQGGRDWRAFVDKDDQRVIRIRDKGITNVFWG